MPILFCVISRGTTVLTKHASCQGNFTEVTEQVISKITPENDKLTYTHSNYLIHYVYDDGVIYLCITDDEFQRSRAFLFLYEVKRRFMASYGSNIRNAIAYAMNPEFSRVLANEMKHYSESDDLDVIAKVHGELDELKNIMVKNIDNVVARGERMDLLVKQTQQLNDNSITFRSTSRNLARSMFWKNIKLYVIIAAVLTLLIYFVISMFCGGLAWHGCLAKK